MNTAYSDSIVSREVTEQIIGCFYRVYNALGYGFLEAVYQKALQLELQAIGLRAESEVPLQVHYRGTVIGDYRADIVVNAEILLELKSVNGIDSAIEAQVLNYLRATDIELALILNFGPKPQIRRLIFDNERERLSVQSV